MSEQEQSKSIPTLDTVFTAIEHWRSHKKDYPNGAIPNDVWGMIFKLEKDGYQRAALRRMFSLNSEQYVRKWDELTSPTSNPVVAELHGPQIKPVKSSHVQIGFCEVSVKPGGQPNIPSLTQVTNINKQTLSELKSTDNSPEKYLDLTTLIVECIRPDGQRLKIHTTNKSLDVVMQAFFAQGEGPA